MIRRGSSPLFCLVCVRACVRSSTTPSPPPFLPSQPIFRARPAGRGYFGYPGNVEPHPSFSLSRVSRIFTHVVYEWCGMVGVLACRRACVRAGLPRPYSSDGAQAHRAAAQVRPPKRRRNALDPLAGVSLILYFCMCSVWSSACQPWWPVSKRHPGTCINKIYMSI